MIPPNPKIICNYYNFNEKEFPKIEFENIPYTSWEEQGNINIISNSNSSIICYRCFLKHEFDEDFFNLIEEIKERINLTFNQSNKIYEIYQNNKIPGFIYNVISDKNNSCLFNYCTSNFNSILYHILLFLGYNVIIDSIWRANIISYNFHSIKKVSSKNNLRVPYNERDRIAFKNIKNDSLNIQQIFV